MERWVESTIDGYNPYLLGINTLDEMERCSTNGAVDRIHNYRIESVPLGIITLDEVERCSTNGAEDRIPNYRIESVPFRY